MSVRPPDSALDRARSATRLQSSRDSARAGPRLSRRSPVMLAVGMPQALAALGYATFSGAMALSRFGGEFLRSRYSEQALLRFVPQRPAASGGPGGGPNSP